MFANHLDFIVSVECGEVEGDALIEGVQAMVDDGTVWHLQGSWQRLASDLIQRGLVRMPPRPDNGAGTGYGIG